MPPTAIGRARLRRADSESQTATPAPQSVALRDASNRIETIRDLVSEGWKLDLQIKRDSDRLREIKASLIAAGGGKHLGARGGEALVIFPGPKIETPRDEKELAALRGDILGDEDFKTLFERIISWRPVKSCRDVAVRILTPMQLKKFLAACEIESSPQVRFS